MARLKLMGAGKFIDMPSGTFYVRYWLDSSIQCREMIEQFTRNPYNFLKTNNLEVYGDNFGSMAFSDEETDYINYYDANVVGDADPSRTLYVVFEEDALPECITLDSDVNGGTFELSKQDVLQIKTEFVHMVGDTSLDEYAKKILETYANRTDSVINTDIEVSVVITDYKTNDS